MNAATKSTRLAVAFVLPSFAGGGAQRVALALLGGLDPRRYRRSLVVFEDAGPFRHELPDDVELHELGSARLRSVAGRLVRVLRGLRPDAVVSTLGYVNLALLAMRRLLPRGVRIIVREANTPSSSLREQPCPPVFRWTYRRLYPRADVVICPSTLIESELERDFGVSPGRLVVLPNPVDVERIREAAALPGGSDDAGPRFVSVARLTTQKGVDRLIEMLAELPDGASLTICGDGPDRALLEVLASRLGVAGRVRFLGFVDNPWRRIAVADAFLLPSRWEGMPNVALEALACGTPVIATHTSGGIEDVAAIAPRGAVTVARTRAEFVAAMARVRRRDSGAERPVLLPDAHRLDRVAARLDGILRGDPADEARRAGTGAGDGR